MGIEDVNVAIDDDSVIMTVGGYEYQLGKIVSRQPNILELDNDSIGKVLDDIALFNYCEVEELKDILFNIGWAVV